MTNFTFDKDFGNEIGFNYNEYIDPIIEKLNEVLEINKETNIKNVSIKKETKKYKISSGTTTFERYRNEEIEKYKKISKQKEFNQYMFSKKIIMTSLSKNEQFSISHDILKKSKDTYLYFYFTQKILEEKYTNNSDYVSIFLTLTTPSRFHKYSSFNKTYNEKYDNETTINEAYRLLNNTFRIIYRDFRINRKFERIEYSKVIEPHKNLTPHLHSILYVKKEYLESFLKHLNNIIVKNKIGEHKIEIIKDTSRGFSYLLKYIQKTTNPQNENDFHFFNGWKKANKIRIFTSSASILNKEIYRKINNVTKLSKDLKDKNPLKNVLENCYIKTKQTNFKINEDYDYIEVGTKKTIKGNKNGRYLVNIKKERIKKENFIGNNFFNVLNMENKGFKKEDILRGSLWDFNRFLFVFEDIEKVKLNKKDILEKFETYKENLKNNNKTSLFQMIFKDLKIKKIGYRIVDFKIFDREKKELIYNKKDFEFERNMEFEFNFKSKYEKEMYYENFAGNEFFSLDLV
ncbi:replication endonuclease [Aliarcobacter butzleri]|uniref:replication endonuclease n=1 Tax=Aliarcobacter butzleri TaxID=28197 RepID=UPI0021B44444|nr:replication endonuclease [Aliarcobacter butzleri]MCT7548087.1 replication endonuclease [Aliarcobacter butzleri]